MSYILWPVGGIDRELCFRAHCGLSAMPRVGHLVLAAKSAFIWLYVTGLYRCYQGVLTIGRFYWLLLDTFTDCLQGSSGGGVVLVLVVCVLLVRSLDYLSSLFVSMCLPVCMCPCAAWLGGGGGWLSVWVPVCSFSFSILFIYIYICASWLLDAYLTSV